MNIFGKPHLAADYVEWMVVEEGREEVSRGDLQPEMNTSYTLGADASSNLNAVRDTTIDDCFDHLQYRLKTLSGNYLFEVKDDVLSRRSGVSADASLVYEFLLCCSQSHLSQRLGLAFSELCKLALQRFLGPRSRVWNVDAGAPDRKVMGTVTPKVVEYLEGHLGVRIDQENLSRLADQGDGGVDVVATLSFQDPALGTLTLLGQCAATADDNYWRDKTHQPKRFSVLYKWANPPVLATFIPVVYRNANGTWFNDINVADVLLFDRVRIMRALDLGNAPLPGQMVRFLTNAISKSKSAPRKTRARTTSIKKNRTAKKAAAKSEAGTKGVSIKKIRK